MLCVGVITLDGFVFPSFQWLKTIFWKFAVKTVYGVPEVTLKVAGVKSVAIVLPEESLS